MKKNPAPFEAHHIIPVNILKDNKELKELLFRLSKDHPELSFNFNEIDNGMMIQKKSIKLDETGHGNHPDYDRKINIKINSIMKNAEDDLDAFNKIKKMVKDTKTTLKEDVLLGTKNVNDITNF